jgi:aspartate/methionine/tyrosine aminotransferase
VIPPFTRRTSWDLRENRLAELVAEARREGRPLIDLTESNPTRVGLDEPAASIARLGDPRGARYEPASIGHASARAAIATYYAERGVAIDPARVVLSASTSEAYGWLFKLLAEPGDNVLVPAPSYPLLEYLAGLEGVELSPYRLRPDDGWTIDLDSLVSAIDRRTRAIVLVHPNNPTGSFVRRDEAADLDALAARHGLALLVDEVFGDYAHAPLPDDRLPTFAGPRRALTFVMSGLSKVALLPQVKLGWSLVLGDDRAASEAMRRLEVIADTYLSVATPVQLALGEILARRSTIQGALLARLRQNLAALDAALAGHAHVARLPLDGGWYAVLDASTHWRDEDTCVEALVTRDGVLVHPGHFFDMPGPGLYVVSLLPEPSPFAEAARRLIAHLARGSSAHERA